MNIFVLENNTMNILHQPKEFETIFKQYYEGLCRYALVWLKDKDESEEIVQKVFVTIWEKRRELEIQTSVKAYLYKSVYHASLNAIKQKKKQEDYLHMKQEKEEISYQTTQSTKELELQIDKAIKQLPEQCGLIFKMSRFQDLKYREIADVLNISIKTVENQMGKALRLMRQNLADFLTVLILLIQFLKH